MVKFSYNVNGKVVNINFESYADMILFVASSDIKDEDFVSLEMGETVINGISGLKGALIDMATAMKELENIEFEEDEDYDCDGCNCWLEDEDFDETSNEYIEEEVERIAEEIDDVDTDELFKERPVRLINYVEEDEDYIYFEAYDKDANEFTAKIEKDELFTIVKNSADYSLPEVVVVKPKTTTVGGRNLRERDIVYLMDYELLVKE